MYPHPPPEPSASHKKVEADVHEMEVLDDLRDAREKSSIAGGVGSGLGEVPKSRRYKVLIGVAGLILLLLVISEFFFQSPQRW